MRVQQFDEEHQTTRQFYERTNIKLEMLGLAATNILSGALGLLPLSLPVGRNLLALRSGATNRVYMLFSTALVVMMGWILWPYMKFLPLFTVSVFNISLGFLLLEPSMFSHYFKYSPRFGILYMLIVASCFFANLIFVLCISWFLFIAFYIQSKSQWNHSREGIDGNHYYAIVDNEDFKKMVLDREKRLERMQQAHEQVSLFQTETVENLEEMLQSCCVYQFRGRFSFWEYKAHLQNMKVQEKNFVVLDFSRVIDNDIEYLDEYERMIQSLEDEQDFQFRVTGFRESDVRENIFYKRVRWVRRVQKKGLLIYAE